MPEYLISGSDMVTVSMCSNIKIQLLYSQLLQIMNHLLLISTICRHAITKRIICAIRIVPVLTGVYHPIMSVTFQQYGIRSTVQGYKMNPGLPSGSFHLPGIAQKKNCHHHQKHISLSTIHKNTSFISLYSSLYYCKKTEIIQARQCEKVIFHFKNLTF